MAGGCVVRDALGPVSDVAGNSSWLSDNLTVARNDSGWLSHSSFENETDSCSTQKCKYGLLNDMQVSQLRRLSSLCFFDQICLSAADADAVLVDCCLWLDQPV